MRLPGGGGSANIVARAAKVVWLHGGDDPPRVQAEVEHVTAAPAADAIVRLHCRWGVVRLGASPALEQVVPGAEDFAAHLAALGVDVARAVPCPDARADELAAARALPAEAAERGYDAECSQAPGPALRWLATGWLTGRSARRSCATARPSCNAGTCRGSRPAR